MEFRLRTDARKWFSSIFRKDDALLFDPYYFCLMAGLAARRKIDVKINEDTDGLVDYFPGAYQEQSKLIIALFLATELELAEIDIKERAAVHRLVEHYISNESPSRLSDEGLRELNRYSYGGFETISESFLAEPRSIEIFLPEYRQLLSNTVQKKGGN